MMAKRGFDRRLTLTPENVREDVNRIYSKSKVRMLAGDFGMGIFFLAGGAIIFGLIGWGLIGSDYTEPIDLGLDFVKPLAKFRDAVGLPLAGWWPGTLVGAGLGAAIFFPMVVSLMSWHRRSVLRDLSNARDVAYQLPDDTAMHRLGDSLTSPDVDTALKSTMADFLKIAFPTSRVQFFRFLASHLSAKELDLAGEIAIFLSRESDQETIHVLETATRRESQLRRRLVDSQRDENERSIAEGAMYRYSKAMAKAITLSQQRVRE